MAEMSLQSLTGFVVSTTQVQNYFFIKWAPDIEHFRHTKLLLLPFSIMVIHAYQLQSSHFVYVFSVVGLAFLHDPGTKMANRLLIHSS